MKGQLAARPLALALALAMGACNGQIGVVPGETPKPNPTPSPGPAPNPNVTPGPAPVVPADADVGRVSIHRLNNLEYDNTIRDLLGVTSKARATFISDEKGEFDNDADLFTVSDARYEEYYNAAEAIAGEAFADPRLAARIVTCTQAETAPADSPCTREIIGRFGMRAWRRPLEAPEIEKLVKVAGDARALGATFTESIQQLVTVMLAVPQFLYRVELDANPASLARHPLGPYELASRLSYWLWSSMPDDRLFALAATGALASDEGVAAEIDRELADPKGAAFTESFAGQWLGIRDLLAHQVEPTAYPDWDEPLRQAMAKEGLAYFDDFLTSDRSFADFLTADFNYVNARLARHYGLPAVAGDALVKVTSTTDRRQGFLGLGAFLTTSSYAYRTAPTLRGRWVLLNLMCETIEKPANVKIPSLDSEKASDPAAQNLNVAARLAEHRDNPMCSGCHNVLDPIGLGLEDFDAIGRARTAYPNGDPVVVGGTLPGGKTFSGLVELSNILSQDRHLTDCASQKLMTYALGRSLGAADQPYLDQIRFRWKTNGTSLRALVKAVAQSDAFRNRRGEM
jgi:hypothetical protein